MTFLTRLKCLFWYFLIYAFIGWIYEVLIVLIEEDGGLVNRDFLFGPYLQVYGFGAVLILLVISPLKKKK